MDATITVEWQGYACLHGAAEVSSPDEAEEVFRTVDRDYEVGPVMLDFLAASGASLSVGAGRGSVSVLTFQESSDPPYFTSLGGKDRPSVDFAYSGQFSEFLGKSLVQRNEAIVALREFVVTGSRPTAVQWEEL